jgi:hypothetical protein
MRSSRPNFALEFEHRLPPKLSSSTVLFLLPRIILSRALHARSTPDAPPPAPSQRISHQLTSPRLSPTGTHLPNLGLSVLHIIYLLISVSPIPTSTLPFFYTTILPLIFLYSKLHTAVSSLNNTRPNITTAFTHLPLGLAAHRTPARLSLIGLQRKLRVGTRRSAWVGTGRSTWNATSISA